MIIDNKKYKLHDACRKGNLETLKHLIEIEKLDINTKVTLLNNDCFSLENSTPLHEACKYLQVNIVRYLLNHGAKVNVKAGLDGYTPLHIITLSGDKSTTEYTKELSSRKKIIEMLLDSGADPFATTNHNDLKKIYTPIDFASLFHHKSILNIFINSLKEKSNKNSIKKAELVSLNVISDFTIKKIIHILINLTCLYDFRNQKNKITGAAELGLDIRIENNDQQKIIKISQLINSNSGDTYNRVTLYLSKMISAIPKDVLMYEYYQNLEGFNYFITHVNVKKLIAYKEALTNTIKKKQSASELAEFWIRLIYQK